MTRPQSCLRPLALLLPLLASAQGSAPVPQDEALPRDLTEAERAWLAEHPLRAVARAATPPPVGPITCPAEYEPMEGLVIAWEGTSSWNAILARIAAEVTTLGDGDVYVAVDSAGEGNSARNTIAAQGADMARVQTMVVTTDSIWMRDYGPRYVFQGGVRAIVDHTYNRPRPNDNRFPDFFAGFRSQARYELPLVHGGGNYHLGALGGSFTTRLIVNENPGLTEPEIHDLWSAYQNVDTSFFTPFPTSVDSTQHIDMWMQVIADDRVVISDWPSNPGSTQDVICDQAAVQMAGAGFTVHRTPAFSVGGTHYTYTNVVMCNDLVLVPSYTQSSVAPSNATALAIWQAALPGKTIVPLDAQAIVTAAGVFHCIVMHVPEPRGGTTPTAYLVGDEGGIVLRAGATHTIEWISDDDVGVTAVDLLLSLDGGQTYPTTIATGLAPLGRLDWTVPATPTTRARLRAVAHDGDGNQGTDESDSDFLIRDGLQAVRAPAPSGPSAGTTALVAGPALLGQDLTLTFAGARPGATVCLLYGPRPPGPTRGSAVASTVGALTGSVAADGTLRLTLQVPDRPELEGQTLHCRAWIQDSSGWTASAALRTRLER